MIRWRCFFFSFLFFHRHTTILCAGEERGNENEHSAIWFSESSVATATDLYKSGTDSTTKQRSERESEGSLVGTFTATAVAHNDGDHDIGSGEIAISEDVLYNAKHKSSFRLSEDRSRGLKHSKQSRKKRENGRQSGEIDRGETGSEHFLLTEPDKMEDEKSLPFNNSVGVIYDYGEASDAYNVTNDENYNITAEPNNPKIIGGKDAGPYEFPFFVTIRSSGSICGASLIAPDIVLTAAHCGGSWPLGGYVIVGTNRYKTEISGSKVARIVSRVFHPKFKEFHFNDLLLLKIQPPVTSIDPVEIAFDTSIPDAQQRNRLEIIGFGRTTNDGGLPSSLQKATVEEFPWASSCRYYFELVTAKQHICVKHESPVKVACFGDSGGPLLAKDSKSNKWLQIGVTSYVNSVCSFAPSVYTRLSGHKTWLQEAVCKLASTIPPSSMGCGDAFSTSESSSVCKAQLNQYQNCLKNRLSPSQARFCVDCMNKALAAVIINEDTCNSNATQAFMCTAPQTCFCGSCHPFLRKYAVCSTGGSCDCEDSQSICRVKGEKCSRSTQCCEKQVLGGGKAVGPNLEAVCWKRKCQVKRCRSTGEQCAKAAKCCSGKCRSGACV